MNLADFENEPREREKERGTPQIAYLNCGQKLVNFPMKMGR
jgi:hypothetical protein